MPKNSTQSRRFQSRLCHSRRSGFTLLELLLVMGILVVLASLSTFAIFNLREGALQKTAFLEIETLKKACDTYKLNVGQFPSSLDDLYAQPSGLTKTQWGGPYLKEPIKLDPWKQPYQYSPGSDGENVIITSAGPDRQPGTEDDVPQAITNT